jgi:hypothetical protein
VAAREKVERLLRQMPEQQVPAALDALLEVERYANTLKVLRKRHPEKSESEPMDSLATIKKATRQSSGSGHASRAFSPRRSSGKRSKPCARCART